MSVSAASSDETRFYELYNEFMPIFFTLRYMNPQFGYLAEDPVGYGIESTFKGYYPEYLREPEEYTEDLRRIVAEIKSLDRSTMSEQAAYLTNTFIEKYGSDDFDYESFVVGNSLQFIQLIPEEMLLTDFVSDLHFEIYVEALEDYDSFSDRTGEWIIENNIKNAHFSRLCRQIIDDPEKPILKHLINNIDKYSGDKEALKKRAETAYKDVYIPSHERLYELLKAEESSDSEKTDGETSVDDEYEFDPDAYEEFIQDKLETDDSIEEIYNYLLGTIMPLRNFIWEFESNDERYENFANSNFTFLDPIEVDQAVKDRYGADFPYPDTPMPRIKFLPNYLITRGATAVCLFPKIDKPEDIVVTFPESFNEETSYDDIFAVITHEGYPGHYYQFYYNAQKSMNPALLYNLTSPSTEEAWGEYAALYTVGALTDCEDAAEYLTASNMMWRAIDGLIEIGVNYYGWTDEEFYEFYSEVLGFSSPPESFEPDREYAKKSRVSYVSALTYAYYPIKLFEMRNELQLTGQYNALDYHTFLLDNMYKKFTDIEEQFYSEYLPSHKKTVVTEIPNTGNNDSALFVVILISGVGLILSRKRLDRNFNETAK